MDTASATDHKAQWPTSSAIPMDGVSAGASTLGGHDPLSNIDGESEIVDQPVSFMVLLKHHTLDWVFGIIMLVVGIGIGTVKPHQRNFFPDDETISHEWVTDTYPGWALVFPLPVVPFLVIIAWSGVVRRRWDEVHRGLLATVVAGGLTLLTTNALKIAVGRLRPCFIDACQPNPSAVAAALNVTYGFARSLGDVCTGESSKIHDARQSFPSGHTSYSFAGMVVVATYLFERMSVGNLRFEKSGHAFYRGDFPAKRLSTLGVEMLVVLAPVIFAALIGISRIDDNKHHWSDVFAGAIIGTISAWVAYFYFVRRPEVRANKGRRDV